MQQALKKGNYVLAKSNVYSFVKYENGHSKEMRRPLLKIQGNLQG